MVQELAAGDYIACGGVAALELVAYPAGDSFAGNAAD